jgi:hypothetical protein
VQQLHSPGARPATAQFTAAVRTLTNARVSFVIVGGVAAVIHGAVRLTYDLDVVYRRTEDNFERLVAALAPLRPYLRDAPAGLPFQFNEVALSGGLNFKLATARGALDLMGELAGVGSFETVAERTISVDLGGTQVAVLDLDALILSKRAAGRSKDLEAIAELELIRSLQHETGDQPLSLAGSQESPPHRQ